MSPALKNTIKIVGFGVLVAVTIGLAYYNKQPATPDMLIAKEKISSIDLYQAFSTDSTTAKNKFSGNNKAIEVTGVITGVSQNQDKQTVALLKTNTEGAAVNCTMETAVANIKEGDNVTIKGFCTGMGAGDADLGIAGDVYMIRCFLTK